MTKIARIVPVFRSSVKIDMHKSWFISVLLTLSKVLQRIVYSRLNDYFDKSNILVLSQYDFRKKSTACVAILDLIEKNQLNYW